MWYLEAGLDWPVLNSFCSDFFHVEFHSKFLIISTLEGGQGPGSNHGHTKPLCPLCCGGLDRLWECVHSDRCRTCRGQTPQSKEMGASCTGISFSSICIAIWGLRLRGSHSDYPSAHLLQRGKRISSHTVGPDSVMSWVTMSHDSKATCLNHKL